jgi:hypothetical protein
MSVIRDVERVLAGLLGQRQAETLVRDVNFTASNRIFQTTCGRRSESPPRQPEGEKVVSRVIFFALVEGFTV